jgi:hypothetical protein
VRAFFSHTYLLRSRLTSNQGVPMGNPHSGVLVTRSAFTYARKNIYSGGPRNKKCTSSTSKCFSVRAKNIFGWHMMAIWGKQHIVAYATERRFTNTRTHRKRVVVSLIKAHIIFTNRTKERNPTKPKSAKSTFLDE